MTGTELRSPDYVANALPMHTLHTTVTVNWFSNKKIRQ
jgi:hypothetical protein